MAPHRRESPATTAYDGVHAGPLGQLDTSGNDSSTAETLRPPQNREPEPAPAKKRPAPVRRRKPGQQPQRLPVIQVGGDLRADLDELKLRLDPVHSYLRLEFNRLRNVIEQVQA